MTKKKQRVLVRPTDAEKMLHVAAIASGEVSIVSGRRASPDVIVLNKKKKTTKKRVHRRKTALAVVKAKPKRRRPRPVQRFVIEDPTGALITPTLPAVPSTPPHELGERPWLGHSGMSKSVLTDEEKRIVMAPILTPEEADDLDLEGKDVRYYIPIDHVHILPTGAVYLPQMRVRQRLSLAFGPGGWGVDPVTDARDLKGNTKGQQYALLVRDNLVGYAYGEQDMFEDNKQQSEASVMESIKSNAIVRGSKDLMIGADCWDPAFGWKFQARMCVRVWREDTQKPQWRRFDQPAWWNETGVVDDSPNRDRYVGPEGTGIAGQREPADRFRNDEVEPSSTHRAAEPGGRGGGRRAVPISEPQVRRLRAIALEAGWPEADERAGEDNFPQLHRALEGVYGIEHIHDIVRGKYKGEYDDIIEAIESGRIAIADYVDGYEG